MDPAVWAEIHDWLVSRFQDSCNGLRGYLQAQADGTDEWADRMIAYCGREADKWHKAAETVHRHMGYHGLHGTDRPLCDVSPNLSWLPAA